MGSRNAAAQEPRVARQGGAAPMGGGIDLLASWGAWLALKMR